jgi:hypothetical protein
MASFNQDGHVIKLDINEVFVFGSNRKGYHNGGAAKQALEDFGAEYGQGEGPQGACYAIPTMNRYMQPYSLHTLRHYVSYFLWYAHKHPEIQFLLTPVGTGIAGFDYSVIDKLFKAAPSNVQRVGWERSKGRVGTMTTPQPDELDRILDQMLEAKDWLRGAESASDVRVGDALFKQAKSALIRYFGGEKTKTLDLWKGDILTGFIPKCSFCGTKRKVVGQLTKGVDAMNDNHLPRNWNYYCQKCYDEGMEMEREAMYG